MTERLIGLGFTLVGAGPTSVTGYGFLKLLLSVLLVL